MTTSVLSNIDVLKPCPFCVKDVVLISSSEKRTFYFSHTNTKVCPFSEIEMSWECAQSLSEAAALWNRRWTHDSC